MKHKACECATGHAVARSAGVVLGRVQKLDPKHQFIREYNIGSGQVEGEICRLKEAIQKASDELQKEADELSDLGHAGDLVPILEAHQMMIQDPELILRANGFIREEYINAEWALKKCLEHIMAMFEAMQDSYLKSRKSDVEHVGQRILEALSGSDAVKKYDASIMVAKDFSPSDVVAMWRAGVPGFISIQGGENSHAMIVARGVGLAGLAGVQGLFEQAEDGEPLILDAEAGRWVLRPTQNDLMQLEANQARISEDRKQLQDYVEVPSTSADGYKMPLMANIEFIEEIDLAVECGADGIGLFRTEFVFMQNQGFPDEETQFLYYERVVKSMGGKPITFRLLDVAADKFVHDEKMKAVFDGENPALGLRGVRMLLQYQDILRTQLRAIVRTAGHADLSILVPMVTVPSEMEEVGQVLADICRELGVNQKINLGCMIEVPAAAFVADALAKVSDFFSIGSNDLVQYSLAVDRADDHVSYLYDVNHPAVFQLIQMTMDAANAQDIPVTICGELAGNAGWLGKFVHMNMASLSMSARQILPMRKQLKQMRALS